MKIRGIFVLFAISAFVEGQWAAAARGFYQPMILSFGAAFAFFNDNVETDGFIWNEWMSDKFSKK